MVMLCSLDAVSAYFVRGSLEEGIAVEDFGEG